jgi:Xaa-Pro aminopeptidase
VTDRESATPHVSVVAEKLGEIQLAMRDKKLEGWLLADHRGQNRIALRALGIGPETGEEPPLRRVFYWLPADGIPVLIAHALELPTLPELPGERRSYTGWAELRQALERTLPSRGAIAMEHATIAASPDVSRVEAGTVGLVESYGARVVPSIDLANAFVGVLREGEIALLKKTTSLLAGVRDALGKTLRGAVTAADVAREAERQLAAAGLIAVRTPMVALAEATGSWPRTLGEGALGARQHATLDLFARLPGGPCAHLGVVLTRGESAIASRMLREASAVRDAAIDALRTRLGKGERVLGYEIDEVARTAAAKLDRKGAIRHRTGSHVGTVPLSGEACTFDGLELADTRVALAGHAWSIHPGLYGDDGGVRAHALVLAMARGLDVLDQSPPAPLVLEG